MTDAPYPQGRDEITELSARVSELQGRFSDEGFGRWVRLILEKTDELRELVLGGPPS